MLAVWSLLDLRASRGWPRFEWPSMWAEEHPHLRPAYQIILNNSGDEALYNDAVLDLWDHYSTEVRQWDCEQQEAWYESLGFDSD